MVTEMSRQVGAHDLTMQSGKLAKLADGAVVVTYGQTQVLATCVRSKPREGIDFFPLTIDVEERAYAAGKIPGSFFRREGRPGETAILTARLIDRPLRPTFKEGFRDEVQVAVTVLSVDMENPYDIPAMNAAACAVGLAGLPFDGPVAAVRRGHLERRVDNLRRQAGGRDRARQAGARRGVRRGEGRGEGASHRDPRRGRVGGARPGVLGRMEVAPEEGHASARDRARRP